MEPATASASVVVGVVSIGFALIGIPQGEAALDVCLDLTRGSMMKRLFQKFPCDGVELSR